MQIFFYFCVRPWIGLHIWNYLPESENRITFLKHLKRLLMTGVDPSECVPKIPKNRGINTILQLFFFFVHTPIFCVLSYSLYFFKFMTTIKILNFIFVKVICKLSYLRWLNFVQEKWLRGHTYCLHEKWLICFRMSWQTFPQNIWVMGRGVSQANDKTISRPSARFMINRTQLKFKNH